MTLNSTIGASGTALNADFERSTMKTAEHGMKTVCAPSLRRPLLIFLLGILCLVACSTGWAQSANRWLFVFNTSAAMRSRTQNVEAVAADLLSTGMHGEMRPGDTIGIWTYDSELRSDEAPLETWNPGSARTIFGHTLDFINRHRYSGPAAFDDVLANMLRVTKMSDTITIILVSDGSDPVKGTPFDASIDAFYKKNYKAQKDSDMPVVTVFRGEGGKMTAFTDNLAPWPVNIPAVPPPKVVTATAPKSQPAAAPAKPAPVVPSLVMIGKKSETVLHPLADYSDESPAPSATEQKSAQTPPPPPAPKPASEERSKVEMDASANPAPPAVPEHSNAPVAAVETPKAAEPTPAATQAAPADKPAANPIPPAQSNVETGVAPAPHDLFNTRNIAVVLGAFLVIICGLILTSRRSRRGSRASLITRSLDREQR